MATTELTERDVTKKMLEDAADDMSAVMKFENAIPTGKKVVKAAIQADVIEAAGELRAEDVLQPKTVEVLTALGVKLSVSGESEVKTSTETGPASGESGGDESEGESEEKGKEAKDEKGKASESAETKKTGKTRTESFINIINELETPISVEKLADLVNDDYVANGGKNNVRQTLHLTKIMMPCAIGFGKVKIIDSKITP